MLDYENKVYTAVATALRAVNASVSVYGIYEQVPESFPCAMVYQINGVTDVQDLSGATTHERVTFQVDVYSNKATGKKAEAKALVSAADAVFMSYGFRRTTLQPTPNAYDATIYRITARYERVIAANEI